MLLLTILALALASGCADEGATTISGELTLDLGYANTGYNFQNTTTLVGQSSEVSPGCAAGGCVVSSNDGRFATAFELWLERGADGEQGLGFRALSVELDGQGSSVSATVATEDRLVTYSSEPGAQCLLNAFEDGVTVDGSALINLDCELFDGEGNAAQLTASLSLSSCGLE